MTEAAGARLLADFLSRDPQRIWAASGAVRRCWDLALLQDLSTRTGDIRTATEGVKLGGSLRPNSTHLAFALRKLAHAATGACLCGLYAADDLFDPSREAEEGHVDILSDRFDPAAGTGHYRCRCRACGCAWEVVEETGYHYPWFRWTNG